MGGMENGKPNGLDAPTSVVVKVQVGDSEYEPRWSFLAEYLLSLRGLTLQTFLEESNKQGPRLTSLMMELLSACIAWQFPTGAAPDALALAAKVTTEQRLKIYPALMEAGRAAGAIVFQPKNAQTPATQPAETLPTGPDTPQEPIQ
jgi:hypothetical protein